MSWRMAMAGLVLLGACAEAGLSPLPPVPPFELASVAEELEVPVIRDRYNRAFEQAFSEEPFEEGAMAVIAEEGGELATFRFVPCRGGAVCSGGETGPVGQLLRSPDWFVLKGLHGATFWLSHGGDGYLERDGTYVPLAWNGRINGTGPGDAPVLETPYPH